jgi:hypothetical protein
MNIHEYYYNENGKNLYIEFSTKEDGDSFYRILELEYQDVMYYSPNIVAEDEINEVDVDFVIELIEQYLLNNDLPEELSL